MVRLGRHRPDAVRRADVVAFSGPNDLLSTSYSEFYASATPLHTGSPYSAYATGDLMIAARGSS